MCRITVKMRIMKKIMRLAFVACAVLLMTGCTKEGVNRFKGNYSYSMSGTLTFTPAAGSDEVTAALKSEMGQMDILTADKSSGAMLLTMRPILGGAIVFEATASGETLTLEPAARRITVDFGDALIGGEADVDVEVSGYGERYSDMLIFRLEYSGSCTHNGTVYNISGSNVDCVAKLNE